MTFPRHRCALRQRDREADEISWCPPKYLTKRVFRLGGSPRVSRRTAWQRHGARFFYPQVAPENFLALIEADCQQFYQAAFLLLNLVPPAGSKHEAARAGTGVASPGSATGNAK